MASRCPAAGEHTIPSGAEHHHRDSRTQDRFQATEGGTGTFLLLLSYSSELVSRRLTPDTVPSISLLFSADRFQEAVTSRKAGAQFYSAPQTRHFAPRQAPSECLRTREAPSLLRAGPCFSPSLTRVALYARSS